MDALGINGGFLLTQIVNFTLMALILRALMWKPLVNALEARRERISRGLEDARAAEQERANAERKAQEVYDQRRAEGQKIVDEARGRGEDQARIALEEARREAESIRAKARQDAEEERNALLDSVRAQVGQIAIAAAERVIGQSLDPQKSQAIVNDFFTKAPAGSISGDIEVTSALPLSQAEQSQVKQQTGANSVTFRVDPNILGGLVVRAGDRVIDGSVRNGLNKLSASMS